MKKQNQDEPTNNGHEGGHGRLRGDDGVLQDGGGAGLDGGDGEADGFVLRVDGMEGLVEAADLAEDVVHRTPGAGGLRSGRSR